MAGVGVRQRAAISPVSPRLSHPRPSFTLINASQHQIFGSAGLAYATAALTVTTLFFGELLPKALGVNNAEVVARRVLPIIIILSVVLNPVAKTFTLISSVGTIKDGSPCMHTWYTCFSAFCVVFVPLACPVNYVERCCAVAQARSDPGNRRTPSLPIVANCFGLLLPGFCGVFYHGGELGDTCSCFKPEQAYAVCCCCMLYAACCMLHAVSRLRSAPRSLGFPVPSRPRLLPFPPLPRS